MLFNDPRMKDLVQKLDELRKRDTYVVELIEPTTRELAAALASGSQNHHPVFSTDWDVVNCVRKTIITFKKMY